MFGHSALKPKEVGLIRLQPVLVISDIEDSKKFAKDFLNIEFDDYIYLIDYENLENYEDYENYNFHTIKIFEEKAELHLKNGKKVEKDFDDLEQLLEDFGREIIRYYHKTMT